VALECYDRVISLHSTGHSRWKEVSSTKLQFKDRENPTCGGSWMLLDAILHCWEGSVGPRLKNVMCCETKYIRKIIILNWSDRKIIILDWSDSCIHMLCGCRRRMFDCLAMEVYYPQTVRFWMIWRSRGVHELHELIRPRTLYLSSLFSFSFWFSSQSDDM
jgi:hypothetical protein